MTDSNNKSSGDTHSPDKDLAQTLADERYGMLKFLTTAVLIFAGFLAVYEYYLLDSDIFIDYLEMSASSATWLLNNFSNELVNLVEVRNEYRTKIVSQENRKSFVVVTSGCDASTVFAVLIATVAAWPSPVLKKLLAMALGLFLMYALNIIRIAGMLIVEVNIPDQFDFYHEWVLPSILVAGPMLYFLFWTRISGTHPADTV